MSYHPEDLMLKSYVEGELDAVSALTIAVHTETCPECKRKVALFEQECGEALFSGNSEHVDHDEEAFDEMFDSIVCLEQNSEPFRMPRKPKQIEVNGKTFTLPVSLSSFIDHIGEWHSYGGKVFSAPVDIADNSRVNLMYIAEDVQIPQHTHKGLESTLVLHGSFSDENGHYQVGDFMIEDGSVKHSPTTSKGQDCLCLTVLTEPMLFTQGIARLFNRFGKGMYP